MKLQRYFPTTISAQILWLENYGSKIATYETPLGLEPAHVDAAVASCNYAQYVLGQWMNDVRLLGPAATSAIQLLLFGSGPAAVVLPTFTAPALPTGVASVPPGVLVRIFAQVQTIKNSNGYTEIIGRDLGIIGSEDTMPDLATVKPEFTLETSGGHVFAKWGWQGLRGIVTAIEYRVSRGAGLSPIFLTIDSTPGYLDTEALPATAAKWTYEAIWRVGDERTGQWSNPVSITVGG